MRYFARTTALLVVAVAPVLAYAQLAPADAIRARINAYRELGASFKNLNDQLKSGQPAKVMLRHSARQIQSASKAQYGWFPAGSGPAPGVKTKAKATIWSDMALFQSLQKKFESEAGLMAKTVEQGDTSLIRKQAASLGRSCKACHDKFREES